jgi:PAS domain-containing protein
MYQAKGITRWGENHIVKLLSGEVMVIYKDITQLKLAEEQLLQSIARYKAMFDFTMNGVAIYEAVDGGSDFVFKDFNPAAEK